MHRFEQSTVKLSTGHDGKYSIKGPHTFIWSKKILWLSVGYKHMVKCKMIHSIVVRSM